MSAHREYTTELRRLLPDHYFQPVPQRALWIVPYAAIVLLGGWVITRGGTPTIWKLALSLPLGMAFASLGFLAHEILHGGVVRSRWARELLGGISFAPLGVAPALWVRWHNVEHHGNTQVSSRDPDVAGTFEQYRSSLRTRVVFRFKSARNLLFFLVLSVTFTLHAGVVLIVGFPRVPGRERMRLAGQVLGLVLFWSVWGAIFGWSDFLYFYAVPLLIANLIIMAYVATNHHINPLLEEDDPLAGSLTVNVPRFLDILHSNFSHHTEHHVFPAMSARYLPQLKRRLKELWPDRYHEMSLWRALDLVRKTPRLYLGNIRLIDPPSRRTYGVLGFGLEAQARTDEADA